jgi:TPR repeat protein
MENLIMAAHDDLFSEAMQALAADDVALARRLMASAAKADHRQALTVYAIFIEHGVGGRPNATRAMAWHRRAADMGEPISCLRLAQWHADNRQIPQAKFWLRQPGFNPKSSLAHLRLEAGNRSVRTTNVIHSIISHLSGRTSALSDEERLELAGIAQAYRNHRPDVKKAQEGRDRMREAARQRRVQAELDAAAESPPSTPQRLNTHG